MFKRFRLLMLIGLLVMGMVALWGNDVSADFHLGGFGFSTCVPTPIWPYCLYWVPIPPECKPYINCSYHANFKIIGGANLKEAHFLEGTYWVYDGWLVGVNPQGKDVRVGIAGLAWAELISPHTAFLMDRNGKQYLDQVLYNLVWEFDYTYYTDPDDIDDAKARCCTWDPGCDDPDTDPCDPLEAWANFWGLAGPDTYWQDLLNKQWTPDQILVTVIDVDGTFLTDCSNPEDPNTCTTSYGEAQWTCATDEDLRDWPGDDNEVYYVCNERGLPIAFDDAYTQRGQTLNVSAPGVLGNDYERDPNVTLQVTHVDTSGTAGTVTWLADGSFSYTPPENGGISSDTFTYVANNGTGDSNVAMVTITVK